MTEKTNHREELRAAMPARIRFNVLPSKDAFTRLPSPGPGPPEAAEAAPGFDDRDEWEKFLLRLDDKLNYIIALLTGNIGRKEYQHQGMVIDISESGLRLLSPAALPLRTVIEMELALPHQPHRAMEVLGEVIREQGPPDDKDQGQNTVGVSFTDILPQDQDAIVHYIFQKQREDIRRQKDRE